MKAPDSFSNPQEQLDLITSFVQDSRTAFKENGFPYLVWGGIASVGTLISYILGWVGFNRLILPLWGLLVVGGIISVFFYCSMRERHRTKRVKLFSARISNTLWVSISAGGIGLWVFALVFKTSFGIQEGLAVLSLLIGIGYLVSSVLTDYIVLRVLGIFWMIGGAICLIIPQYYSYAFIGAMAFFFEFIPGLVMQLRERKTNTNSGSKEYGEN